ncbi:RRM domain-containing protein [Trichonephila inaurata madagascariensis]|uniref:RRM domain-containing protein n=1 Tax=Trichonephila inaurata madagascariensis TaxID=2747483 RepID=A0A8X7CBH3_9ARAC|nr:RRM domain-containing protein [Trichonephila inaurata madagascariensis]
MNMEVMCSSVEDAITFYGCPVKISDELVLIMNSLSNLNLNQNRSDKKSCMKKEDLKQVFSKYGEIKQVLCRWQGSYFDYGIVKFFYKHDADRVLRQTNHVTLIGYTMSVKTARKSDHSHQNGQLGIENKNSYPDMNKNHVTYIYIV